MSIQRYNWFPGGMSVAVDGTYVRLDDHVQAMAAEAESAHDLGVIYGINHERARIKAAVQSLRKNYYGEELDLAKVKGYLLAIIDGDTYDGQWHRDLYGKD